MRRLSIIIALLSGLFVCQQVGAQQPRLVSVQLYSIRDVIGNAETYAKNHVEVFKRLHEMDIRVLRRPTTITESSMVSRPNSTRKTVRPQGSYLSHRTPHAI